MKRSVILPFVLTLALFCALAFLSMTYARMRDAEQTLERLYESGLASSCEQLQQLQLSLDKALLTPDVAARAQLLSQISRDAYVAKTGLSALPVAQTAMLSAAETTGGIARDAESMAATLRGGGALTEEQLACLRTASADCALLSGRLALMRQELPEASSAEAIDLSAVPVVERDVPIGLPNGTVTGDEAMTIAARVVGEGRVVRVLHSPGTTGVLPAHGVTVETPGLQLNLEITQQGGQLLWMMPETASFAQVLDENRCREAAEAFMGRLGLPAMELTAWQRYDGLYVASFVPMQDGVLLYPDLVHVQVRMDTGDVVGFEAASYWTHHTRRQLPEPRVTTEEARATVAPHAQVQDVRLCLITREHAEVLCHQVVAVSSGETYYVYLDAQTGQTVAVQKLMVDENGIQPA